MEKTLPGGEITTIWNKNFICVMCTNFLLCLAHSAVNPLVATYALFIGVGEQYMGVLAGMFYGIALAMRPVTGPVTTRFDRRKLLILVFVLGCIASVGYAVFHNAVAFVLFRFLSGLQYSLIGSLMMTLAGDNLPNEKMASGLGIYGAVGAIGIAIAPAISSVILDFGTERFSRDTGFTFIFSFAAIILALAIIPSVIMNPDSKSRERVASTGAWYKNIITVHALPITVILFLTMVPYSLYNTYMFEFGNARGISQISVFYLVLALTLAVSRPMSGVLTDRLGTRNVMYPALVLFASSFLIVSSGKSLTVVLIGAAIAAIGYGAAQPSLQAMGMQSVPDIKRGVASNTIYIGIDLALFMGPIFGNWVYLASKDYAVMFKSAIVPIALAGIFFAVVMPSYRRRLEKLRSQR